MPKAGKILADLNISDFIRDMGLAIAEAQTKLDTNSVDQTLRMGQTVLPGMTQNLLSLGLRPAFYHFQYADLEVNLNVYYSTTVDVDVNFNYDRENESSEYSLETSSASGSATLTVQDGEGIPPYACLALVANAPGHLTVGTTSYALDGGVGPNSTGLPVARQDTLWETAQELLVALRNNSSWTNQAAGDLGGVFMDWEMQSGVTASTTRPDLYAINRSVITVRTSPQAAPGDNLVIARLGSVTPAPALLLPATNGTRYTSTAATVGAALADIGQQVDPAAFVVVSGADCNRALYFDTDIHDVPTTTYGTDREPSAVLDAVAALLAENPSASLVLEGWADLRTPPAPGYNQRLSQKRADYVLRALTSRGVAASRLTARGMGATVDFSGSDLAANRRVVFKFAGVPAALVARTVAATAAFDPTGADREARIVPRTRAAANAPTTAVVTFRGTDFTQGTASQGTTFAVGATAESTAANLARAIRDANANTAFGAFARGDRVYLYGTGDHALFTLFARTPTAPVLSAAGSIRVARRFGDGRPPASPQPRDTVVIDNVQLVAVETGVAPQPGQFTLGVTAADTARNLAAAITAGSSSGLLAAGLQAQSAGNIVTVSGPSGTMLGTSNPAAFLLSANRIAGKPSADREESSERELRALNVDAHLAVKYELSVSGSSTIKARLVAVPAPPQFLQAIGDYLQRWYP
ncbi:OmpA family protein [Corallococcus sp. AB011P]|uniref:OmpA family protein n=1 Tax=Corallococcus sp. AB011P TaxID=2316735 RepID=UPI000EA2B73E|nr:OmpA family protein [Corallococcus sp. AB011P]RKG55858.1 OmpA family protein [Corallococcus sp. AB011P]